MAHFMCRQAKDGGVTFMQTRRSYYVAPMNAITVAYYLGDTFNFMMLNKSTNEIISV